MEASACAPSRPAAAALQPCRRSNCWMAGPINTSSAPVKFDCKGYRMFIFGLGYVGRYVSEQLKQEGWQVSGTCRDAIKKRELEELSLDAFIFGTNSKLRTLSTLHDATHILISVPPMAGVGDPLLSLHEDLQRSLISCGNLQWLGYLSTTSVYGDCGGALVDEDCPVNPKMESAKLRLVAENGWLNLGHELGSSINVFRLGGIYGSGRSALDTIIKQKFLSKKQKMRESRIYTSRVHVADIYQSIKASFNVPPSSGRIYNVVDDDPAPRAEVFAFARDLIVKKWPGVIMDIGGAAAANIDSLEEDSTGEKRVSNARIKNELGVRLVYPSYREGLESIIGSMDIPSSHLRDI